jgi:uncharacterized protein (TIGR03067 family)
MRRDGRVRRVVLALLAVLGVTAFAPAPFPRTERRSAEARLDLNAIQGVWAAVSIDVMQNGKLRRISWGVRRIYVRKGVWGFDQDGSGFYVTLNASRRPVTIDFRSAPGEKGQTAISGVLRLQGDTLQVLYVFTQPDTRPTQFEHVRDGDRLMTLRLERR